MPGGHLAGTIGIKFQNILKMIQIFMTPVEQADFQEIHGGGEGADRAGNASRSGKPTDRAA